MKPLCRLTGGHCVECSPPQWPLILILLPWSLVTGVRPVTHCLSSAPVSPRVSQFSQHLTTPGPVSRGPGPASPDCQPGPRTDQITDTSLLLLDSNTISGANAKQNHRNNKINQTSCKFDKVKLFGEFTVLRARHKFLALSIFFKIAILETLVKFC